MSPEKGYHLCGNLICSSHWQKSMGIWFCMFHSLGFFGWLLKASCIISVLSNTLPPSNNPVLCPDLETWPLPGFHLPISRHISHYLPSGFSCIPRCPSARCQPEPLVGLPGSVPALSADPFLPPGRSCRCPAGSRGAGADSEPRALFGSRSRSQRCSTCPCRAGAGMAAPAAPSSARPAPGRGQAGSRHRPQGASPRRLRHGAVDIGCFVQGGNSGERTESTPKRWGKGRPSPLAWRILCSFSPASHYKSYFSQNRMLGQGR